MTGQVITIAQQKGGSGKTTLAAHLAVAWIRLYNKSVAIVDIDPQGSLGRWFLSRRSKNESSEPDMGFATASAWGARYEAEKLAKDFDIVIIDTPPKMGLEGRTALEAADLVIIPVTPSPLDIWATEPTIEMINSLNKPSLLVLNRVINRAKLTSETAAALSEMKIRSAKTRIGNRVIFASCIGSGGTVLENQPSGKAAREIMDLTREVVGEL